MAGFNLHMSMELKTKSKDLENKSKDLENAQKLFETTTNLQRTQDQDNMNNGLMKLKIEMIYLQILALHITLQQINHLEALYQRKQL